MKHIKFAKNPTFAELWDACVYSFLYDTKKYTDEFSELLKSHTISKNAKIMDSSAGTGFPAIELAQKGYSDITCMDAMDDEIAVFTRKANAKKLKLKCDKHVWLEMPNFYKKESFDLLLCRGNSFIYAGGGWNKEQKVDAKKSRAAYVATLKVFYAMLRKGGELYIDKFQDREIPGKHKVADVQIKDKKYDLLFYTEIMRDKNMRRASMLLRDKQGNETGTPNMTYLLTKPELISYLKEAGFSEIQEIKLKSESHFDVILAKK